MSELHDILSVFAEIDKQNTVAALVTLCKVTGSSYRRPGARMVVTSKMPAAGAISGGCLEADAFERAKKVMATGEPLRVTYDATRNDEALWALNLGCRGVSEVLVEKLSRDSPAARHLRFAAASLEKRELSAVATVFRVSEGIRIPLGARVMRDTHGVVASDLEDSGLGDGTIMARFAADLAAAMRERESRTVSYELPHREQPGGTIEVFIDVIGPPLSLVVFGAGYGTLPLVALAKPLGWDVTVIDHRPAYARPERIPAADRVILACAEQLREQVRLDEDTAAVIVTHQYTVDAELLRQLLPSPVRYVGLLSSETRVRELLDELARHGFTPDAAQLEKLHAPVGLDLGGEGPESIAVAIIAEIEKVVRGGTGRSLRDVKGTFRAS
ncbi:MAG: XdhC family protein [Planctomycetota bacterium]